MAAYLRIVGQTSRYRLRELLSDGYNFPGLTSNFASRVNLQLRVSMKFQIRRVLFAAAVIGLVISIGIISINAQGDVNDVLRLALQFLGKQLGTTITAPDNYTYQQMTFIDTSFGCPQP